MQTPDFAIQVNQVYSYPAIHRRTYISQQVHIHPPFTVGKFETNKENLSDEKDKESFTNYLLLNVGGLNIVESHLIMDSPYLIPIRSSLKTVLFRVSG